MSLIIDQSLQYQFFILSPSSCDFPPISSEFYGNLKIIGDPLKKTLLNFPTNFQMILYDSSNISFSNITLRFFSNKWTLFMQNDQANIIFSGCNLVYLDENVIVLTGYSKGNVSFIDCFVTSENNSLIGALFKITSGNIIIINNLTSTGLEFPNVFIAISNVFEFSFLNSKFELNSFSASLIQLTIINYGVLKPFRIENLFFGKNTKNGEFVELLDFSAIVPIYMSNLSFYENSFFDEILQIANAPLLHLTNVSAISNYKIGQFFVFTTCTNIFLKNFNLSFNAGAISSSGTLIYVLSMFYGVWDNLTFLNNTSYDQPTGIIFVQQGQNLNTHRECIMSNIFILNNNAIFDSSRPYDSQAGFLFVKGVTNITLSDSFFINNKVLNGGETIINYVYVVNNNEIYTMAILIIDCNFNGNVADSSVNGIYFPGEIISIYNSSFENHQGGDYGVFYLNSEYASFVNNTFKNCDGRLGSIFYIFLNFAESSYYFEQILFINNTAEKASIFLSTIYPFNMTFLTCYFSNNYVTKQGGVFFIKYSDGDPSTHIFSLFSCFFEDNFAAVSGGVGEMWQLGGQVNILDCVFRNNTSAEGGVFNLNQEITTNNSVVTCLFLDNSASLQAAIFNILCATFNDESSNYYFNTGEVAAIYFVSSYCVVNLQNSNIYRSFISSLGNIVLVAKPTVFINNLSIYDSVATVCSGVSFSGLVNLTIDGLNFFNNFAYRGTLFYSSSLLSEATLKNIVSVNNSATIGLSSFSFTKVTFQNAHFINSSSIIFSIQYASLILFDVIVEEHQCSLNQVGCIVNIISKSSISVNNISCYNVTSLESLGVIYSSSSIVNISDSYFINATVASVADILYAEMSQIYIKRTMIKNYKNSAMNLLQDTTFSLEECVCTNHYLSSLACLNISMTTNVLISDSFFSNISFSVISFYNDLDFLQGSPSDIPIIQNSFFSNNVNTGSSNNIKGGCIFVQNSHLNLTNSTFLNNTAEIGGAIFLSSNDVLNTFFLIWLITSNSFIENSANTSGGGAIFWDYNLPAIKISIFARFAHVL